MSAAIAHSNGLKWILPIGQTTEARELLSILKRCADHTNGAPVHGGHLGRRRAAGAGPAVIVPEADVVVGRRRPQLATQNPQASPLGQLARPSSPTQAPPTPVVQRSVSEGSPARHMSSATPRPALESALAEAALVWDTEQAGPTAAKSASPPVRVSTDTVLSARVTTQPASAPRFAPRPELRATTNPSAPAPVSLDGATVGQRSHLRSLLPTYTGTAEKALGGLLQQVVDAIKAHTDLQRAAVEAQAACDATTKSCASEWRRQQDKLSDAVASLRHTEGSIAKEMALRATLRREAEAACSTYEREIAGLTASSEHELAEANVWLAASGKRRGSILRDLANYRQRGVEIDSTLAQLSDLFRATQQRLDALDASPASDGNRRASAQRSPEQGEAGGRADAKAAKDVSSVEAEAKEAAERRRTERARLIHDHKELAAQIRDYLDARDQLAEKKRAIKGKARSLAREVRTEKASEPATGRLAAAHGPVRQGKLTQLRREWEGLLRDFWQTMAALREKVSRNFQQSMMGNAGFQVVADPCRGPGHLAGAARQIDHNRCGPVASRQTQSCPERLAASACG
jgi:hypothetical protein